MCCPGLKMPRSKSEVKKLSHVMLSPPPPLSFIHIPFDVLRVIINEAFYEALHATIHRALKATINGTHVTELMGETEGWRVWDQAPSGVGEKVVIPPPPPRGQGGHISPPWPPVGYRVFFGPRPKSKPVRTKTGKTGPLHPHRRRG